MKKTIVFLFMISAGLTVFAQDKEEKEEKEKTPFKENLFTGGTISAGFGNNSFLIGASPFFGYSVTNWMDAGIVVNYSYSSFRNYTVYDDRLRQTVYGGGPFLKLYPVRFLFVQAQFEQNFIRQKYIAPGGNYTEKANADAGSFLVGGGYTSGRYGKGGNPFFYMSLLFDIGDSPYSPYKNAAGQSVPILSGGIQVPLFQGKGR